MLDTPDPRLPDDLNLGAPESPASPPRRAKIRAGSDGARSGHMVRNTPAEVRQRRFATSFRGYDRMEVRMFLSEVADDLEQALQEITALNRDLGKIDRLLDEHRSREQTLRDTLLTAQQLSDDLRAKAQEKADGIVRDAESRADLLVEKAHLRLTDIEREIDQLKAKRHDVEMEIEESLASLQRSLDTVRAQDKKDAEERIRLLRPRRSDGATRADQPQETSDGPLSTDRLREHQS